MLVEEEAEEAADTGAAWASLPTTKKVAEDLLSQTKQALASLLAAAEQSSDPKVTAAYAHYETSRRFLEGFAMHEQGTSKVRLVETLKLEPIGKRKP